MLALVASAKKASVFAKVLNCLKMLLMSAYVIEGSIYFLIIILHDLIMIGFIYDLMIDHSCFGT